MKSAQHLFADLTVMLEDAHAAAVEGQAPDASPDMHEIFALSVGERLVAANNIVISIFIRLGRPS